MSKVTLSHKLRIIIILQNSMIIVPLSENLVSLKNKWCLIVAKEQRKLGEDALTKACKSWYTKVRKLHGHLTSNQIVPLRFDWLVTRQTMSLSCCCVLVMEQAEINGYLHGKNCTTSCHQVQSCDHCPRERLDGCRRFETLDWESLVLLMLKLKLGKLRYFVLKVLWKETCTK